MILSTCEKCEYGTVQDGLSHCTKEHLYSHFTHCIQRKSVDEFIDRHAVGDDVLSMASN